MNRCSLHVFTFSTLCCLCLPAPRATCLGGGRANEHPWVGGILASSAPQLFDSSQSKSAVNSLHLSTVSAVPSGPGRWQAGSSGQLAGCEERWHISLRPCVRLTQPKVWLGCALLTHGSPALSVPGGQIGGLA